MITTQTRSLAEADQFCEICGERIGNGLWSPPWPKIELVVEADFRPHEITFKRPVASNPAGTMFPLK